MSAGICLKKSSEGRMCSETEKQMTDNFFMNRSRSWGLRSLQRRGWSR